MKKFIVILSVIPNIASADVINLIKGASNIVTGILIPMAFTLCLFYFFWGVAKYIRVGAGSEESSKEGKRIMILGIVGLFIAFSVWGIITFIQNELGIPGVQNVNLPPVVNTNINYNI
jgi:hypothetical protein